MRLGTWNSAAGISQLWSPSANSFHRLVGSHRRASWIAFVMNSGDRVPDVQYRFPVWRLFQFRVYQGSLLCATNSHKLLLFAHKVQVLDATVGISDFWFHSLVTFNIQSLVYSCGGKKKNLHPNDLFLGCVCVSARVIFEQNKRSSVSSRIDGTVLRNNTNLKNAFSRDNDPICLLFIVFSVRQIITVACWVRKPQLESAPDFTAKWGKKILGLCWNFILILLNKGKFRDSGIFISIKPRIIAMYLCVHLWVKCILEHVELLFPSSSWLHKMQTWCEAVVKDRNWWNNQKRALSLKRFVCRGTSAFKGRGEDVSAG